MSTDFYLACHDCKKIFDIGSQSISGWKFYSGEKECMDVLREFVEYHTFNTGHKLEIVPEQSIADEEYEHIEWSATPISTIYTTSRLNKL